MGKCWRRLWMREASVRAHSGTYPVPVPAHNHTLYASLLPAQPPSEHKRQSHPIQRLD
jgi:hypothetical protein